MNIKEKRLKHAVYMRIYYQNPINREKKKIRDLNYGKLHRKQAIIRATEWAKKHKTKRKRYLKNYHQIHKKEIKIKKRIYEEKNKESIRIKKNKYNIRKCLIDLNFKLKRRLRRSIYGYIKKDSIKSGSAVRDLGCTVPELIKHLESKFTIGMNWQNWTKDGWHIDHIQPLSKFDLTDRKQFLQACHYTNLQPLWAIDNIKKSNK